MRGCRRRRESKVMIKRLPVCTECAIYAPPVHHGGPARPSNQPFQDVGLVLSNFTL